MTHQRTPGHQQLLALWPDQVGLVLACHALGGTGSSAAEPRGSQSPYIITSSAPWGLRQTQPS